MNEFAEGTIMSYHGAVEIIIKLPDESDDQ